MQLHRLPCSWADIRFFRAASQYRVGLTRSIKARVGALACFEVQWKVVSAIRRCCTCSKSAAKSLLQVAMPFRPGWPAELPVRTSFDGRPDPIPEAVTGRDTTV